MRSHRQRQRNRHVTTSAFSVDLPASWEYLNETHCAQILPPSGSVAVTISTFGATSSSADRDARHHLASFVEGEHDVRVCESTPSRAEADYKDEGGATWRIVMLTTPKRLILATLNGDLGEDFEEGKRILKSLQP